MKYGKYAKKGPARRRGTKPALLLACLMLVFCLSIGGTLAYIVINSDTVNNEFVPGKVACTVNGNGTVTNGPNSNVDAYIRAAVVVNWMDKDGNVYGIGPNYTVSVNEGWTPIGEFYYYTAEVAPNGKTNTAPVDVSVSGNPPSAAYSLSIEIVAEAIQAEGIQDGTGIAAVLDAWGVALGGN